MVTPTCPSAKCSDGKSESILILGKPGLWIEAEIYKGVIPADQLWEEIKAGKNIRVLNRRCRERRKKVKIKSEDGKEEEADLITSSSSWK